MNYKPNFYFNAITLYRVYHKLSEIFLFRIVSRFLEFLNYLLFNSVIPSASIIGVGTYCSHRGMAVVIHKNSKIGKNCVIGTSVVLGGGGKDKAGAPVLGDNVYIGTGAKILGNIKIGNNVTIGANSVVTKDIPDNCTVVGVPGRIL